MKQTILPSDRPKINLSDFEKDMIRHEFHLLLTEQVYPTLNRMMTRLLADFPDFSIKSKTTLSKELKPGEEKCTNFQSRRKMMLFQ